ncbi:MAG: VanZ family protein [Candidatus Nomurabacteria bacterium]|jgi:glycopeptide antibiotics resistance protein|nr:VanZ family protein [Candidatus Nomurabacteria bacterium]
MLSLIGNFSDSFLLSIFLWPFVAIVLTLPVLLVQYVRFHRLPKARVAVIYLFMLYALALLAFTLYPMPDDPSKFCANYNLSPQLNPLQFISDIREDGLRAVFQVVMNVMFFVPLGVFLRNLFGRKIFITLLAALLVSLFIETAQLTGAFNFYPCSYRLFDVDDIAFNVLGAMIGYLVARVLPNFSKPKKRDNINTNPGIVHRFVTFLSDWLVYEALALVLVAPLFLISSGDVCPELALSLQVGCFVVLQLAVPLFWRGQTLMAKLTGISLDDRERTPLWRYLFYLLRLILVSSVVFLKGWVLLLVALAVLLWYLIFKKMPYALVDLLFARAGKAKKGPGPAPQSKK